MARENGYDKPYGGDGWDDYDRSNWMSGKSTATKVAQTGLTQQFLLQGQMRRMLDEDGKPRSPAVAPSAQERREDAARERAYQRDKKARESGKKPDRGWPIWGDPNQEK